MNIINEIVVNKLEIIIINDEWGEVDNKTVMANAKQVAVENAIIRNVFIGDFNGNGATALGEYVDPEGKNYLVKCSVDYDSEWDKTDKKIIKSSVELKELIRANWMNVFPWMSIVNTPGYVIRNYDYSD